jgi:hypothetical protein
LSQQKPKAMVETVCDGTDSAAQPTTCGQGLAEHAQFPLNEVFASMAENLQLHMAALDFGTRTPDANTMLMNSWCSSIG